MTYADLAGLPIAEKILLMESLWESLSNESTVSSVIPSWHSDVLAERGLRLDQGQEPVSDWSEAKERMRKLSANP